MSVIEDLRKLLEGIVTPDLKALQVKVQASDEGSKPRDEALSAKIDTKFELVSALMVANHATVMNAFTLCQRESAILGR